MVGLGRGLGGLVHWGVRLDDLLVDDWKMGGITMENLWKEGRRQRLRPFDITNFENISWNERKGHETRQLTI